MYPDQASLGNTNCQGDAKWDENEEEEETGNKPRKQWPDDVDNCLVRGSWDALHDLDDEDKPEPTDEIAEEHSQTGFSPGEEADVSFSLFHPPQQELLSESISVPEDGSLIFTNSSLKQAEVPIIFTRQIFLYLIG